MTHATLHTTNHPRRAHPAVIRAALRLHNHQIKQADGNTSATYTYDSKQLRQIGESVTYATNGAPFTLASSTTYNALGQKTSQTYPDGASYTYSFDTNNQLSTVNLPQGYGSITLNSYLWNVPSQITLPGGTVRNYSYDTLDHLTGATYSNSSQTNESYSYDPLANRITGSNANAQGSNHSYNANNQLTQAGSVSYTYDANGNTTSQTDSSDPTNTRSYVYDTDNRLIEVHDAANAIIATYRYDPFGRRLSKTLNTTGQGSSTYYFYSAEGLIAEADSNGQITQSYGYAPGSTFSTNPLWTKLTTAGTATYYTYQNDHLGTPQKLLNQSGITVWSATYDAFGRATIDPASTITNNLRFPGQYADQETGLHYNWNRYYDPVNGGRYISSDPVGLYGGTNLYSYVKASPIISMDPTGLVKIYGNWCGPDWTGGRTHSYTPISPTYYKAPIDNLDKACETHDVCYFECRESNNCDKQKRASCFRKCDHVLTKSAYEIGGFWGGVIGAAIDRPGNRDPGENGASCNGCKKNE